MLITITALALAFVSPQKAIVQEMQEMAYIAGRCTVWMDATTKADIEQSINTTDPRLMTIYREGINDAHEGIRYDVCERLLNESRMRLERLNHAIRNSAR